MYLKFSEFYATCNNLISNTVNTTHLVISEDRKLLRTFKSDFVLSQYVKSSLWIRSCQFFKCRCIYQNSVCVRYQEV